MARERSPASDVIHAILSHPDLTEAMRGYYRQQFSQADRAAHARRRAANRPTDLEYAVPVRLPGTNANALDFPFQYEDVSYVATVEIDSAGTSVSVYKYYPDRKRIIYYVRKKPRDGNRLFMPSLRLYAPPRVKLYVFQSILALVRRFMPMTTPSDIVVTGRSNTTYTLHAYMTKLITQARQA